MTACALPRGQRGAAAVEFALVSLLLVTLLMAITGFGHWLYTLEMVADATRAGVRAAVVCDINDSVVKTEVRNRVPQLGLSNAQVSLQYFPPGCNRSNCRSVEVRIAGATYTPWVPFFAVPFPVPPFTASLPRESLESTNAAGEINPVCG